MSFFSDLFKGDFGNLGHDLNPSNAFSDFGTDLSKGLKNPAVDVALAGGAALALPFLAPELLAGAGSLFGGAAATDAAAGGASAFAADTAATGDLTSFLADPVAAATGATTLPNDALALTAPVADVTGTAGVAGGGGAVPGSLDALAISGPSGVAGGGTSAPLDLAAAGGGANPASGGFLSSLTSNLSASNLGAATGKALSSPGTLIGLGGLGLTGYNALEQKKALNALNATEQKNASIAAATSAEETSAAAPLLNNGQTLMSYLTTNTLPPQFQQQIDQMIATQKAGIIQGYATRGMPTDPTKNSGLQQDLAAVDQQALTMKGNFETMLATAGNQMVQTANQLLASGLSATQLSAEIPIQMATLDANLNKQMSDALSNFAAAINGGGNKTGKSISVNLG